MVNWPVQIGQSNIKLNAPEKISAGTEFDLTWTGDGSHGDVIGIRRAGSVLPLANASEVRADTKKGRLTAPLIAGDYELIYQTAHSETQRSDVPLALRKLKVIAGSIQIVAPPVINAGEAKDFLWPHGPGNTSEYSIWSGEGETANRITTLQNPGNVRLLVPPGSYQIRLMEGNTLLAANPITVLPSRIFETGLTGLKPGAVLSFPKSVRAGFFDEIGIIAADAPLDGGKMLASAVEVGDHLELELPASAGQFELVLIGRDNLSTAVVLGHAPLTLSGAATDASSSQIQIPPTVRPLDEVAISWKNSQQQVLEIWSAEKTKQPKLQRKLLRPDSYRLALPPGEYRLRLRAKTALDDHRSLDQDEINANAPPPPALELTGSVVVKNQKIMLDVPVTVMPKTRLTVKIAGKPGFFDKIVIVRAGERNPERASLGSTRAQDGELEAPSTSGKYELVYLGVFELNTAERVLERLTFTVQ